MRQFEFLLELKVASLSNVLKSWMEPLVRVDAITHFIEEGENLQRVFLKAGDITQYFLADNVNAIQKRFKDATMYLTQPSDKEGVEGLSVLVFVVSKGNFVFLASIKGAE